MFLARSNDHTFTVFGEVMHYITYGTDVAYICHKYDYFFDIFVNSL